MGHHAHDAGRTLAFVPGVFALALSGEADRGQGPRQRLGWTVRLLAAGVLVSVAVLWATPAGAATCESLVALSLPNATIASAVSVPGPTFTAPNGQTYDVPPFCKVSAVSSPTPDSVINIEVWMPSSRWNGRFEGTGNGGYAGNISLSVQPVARL